MNSPVSQWIEEDMFTSLSIILDNYGVNDPEKSAHDIMDAHTTNGILNVELLEKNMKESAYSVWEKETLSYAPDYYTIENDYDDDIDLI